MVLVISDPWVIPSRDLFDTWGKVMPLSPTEVNYVEIVSASSSTSSHFSVLNTSLDMYSQYLQLGALESPDPLVETLLANEGIMEVMPLEEPAYTDTRHHSSFLPYPAVMSTTYEESSSLFPSLPLPPLIMTLEVWLEGNLGNITQTMSIDISIKIGIVEHVHIGVSYSLDEIKTYTHLFQEFHDVFAWSYEEMPGIDPSIVVHEIPTYLQAKPIRQWLHPVHPRKATTIKGEVEKLLKARFIYPIPLTDWVSNIVLVTRKQGTISACIDYGDLNRVCLKNNYPTPLIYQIIDECAKRENFSFMDGFFGYNQINIAPADQEKKTFIYPWGRFMYKKLPFGIKNARAMFQREISYAFHDIHNIIQTFNGSR